MPPKALSIRRRERLFRKAKGQCTFCGGGMVQPSVDDVQKYPGTCTRDHVVPRSAMRGLRNNSTAACAACNNTRGYIEFGVFKQLRRYMLKRGWPPCTWPPFDIRKEIMSVKRRPNTIAEWFLEDATIN